MADNVKLFTAEFINKESVASPDKIAGTDNTTGNPIRIDFRRLVASICQAYNTYLFQGIATPTTTPPLGESTISKLHYFYLTNTDGNYTNFLKTGKPALPITLLNEVAVIISEYWKDPDDDSMKLRWKKETLCSLDGGGGVDFNDIIKTEIAQLLSFGIGVINVEYIQPSPSEEMSAISYVKWVSNKWVWYYRPSLVSSAHITTNVEIETKVLLSGKYHTLQESGAWSEDAAISVNALTELIASDFIGVIKGRISNNIPVGSKGIFYMNNKWNWNIGNPEGSTGSIQIDLPNGIKAFNSGISAIPGVEQYKTYILKANGDVEPDEPGTTNIGILHEFDAIVGNWAIFHSGDSLLLKSTNVFDIDAIHIQIKNLDIQKVDIYVDGSAITYSSDHLIGKVTGERLKDGGYMYHMVGIMNGTTPISTFTYLP